MNFNRFLLIFLVLLTLISIIKTNAEASDKTEKSTLMKDDELKGFYFHEQIKSNEKRNKRISLYVEIWRSMPRRHYMKMKDLYARKGELYKLHVYKVFIGVQTYTSPEAAKKRLEYLAANPPPGDIKAKWSKDSYNGNIFGDQSYFVTPFKKESDYKGIMFVKGNKLVEIFTFGIVDNKVLDEKFIEDVAEKVSNRLNPERSSK